VTAVERRRFSARERGLAAGAAAYAMWGVFPLYFKALAFAPPVEILAHRVVWALAVLLPVVRGKGLFGEVRAAMRPGRSLWLLMASALLIATNWLVYIYAVVTGRILEGSFGYFVNPLVSVLLGVFLLGERPDRPTWIAVGFAAAGVVYMTITAGELPWIALVIAVSFGGYGMLRKIAPVGAVAGLTVETLLLFPLAGGYLVFSGLTGGLVFGSGGRARDLLLVLAGPLTVFPLLLFTGAARRLPLSLLGLLQYLTPTLQFGVGVFVYRERLTGPRVIGFACIWTGLALFIARTLQSTPRRAPGKGADAKVIV
jgi:chloramphenicol-sensitive protein RarD